MISTRNRMPICETFAIGYAKKSRTVLRQVQLAYESLFGCQPADGAARHTRHGARLAGHFSPVGKS